jgi:hypothetical protein
VLALARVVVTFGVLLVFAAVHAVPSDAGHGISAEHHSASAEMHTDQVAAGSQHDELGTDEIPVGDHCHDGDGAHDVIHPQCAAMPRPTDDGGLTLLAVLPFLIISAAPNGGSVRAAFAGG